ncbi:MAG: hypothetical protein KatS3mg105_4426 [Gemmatales bacterium]|nr:MAG: hypothetical protein KatS3mg105_4426 [Gemmatales bacterium]
MYKIANDFLEHHVCVLARTKKAALNLQRSADDR